MNLVWKLLRQHISVPQFAGFFFAILFGMLIVLLGFQFYHDVVPIFTAEDSFMKSDFMIVNKKIGTASSISGRSNTFSNTEVDDMGEQAFSDKIGKFTSTEYKVDANMSVNGVPVLDNGEISFESVPDNFVEVKQLSDWKYTPGSKVVPIILPRIYLTMYNFGFAQSHSLPKISDGLIGMIDFQIFVHGNKKQAQFKGKVIGFSSRLSSILVPQAFMDWSNNEYAPGQQTEPTRLIMSLKNPGDQNFTKYLDKKGYEIENDKLNTEKTTYFLKMMVTMVMVVGLIISVLSFYILMLSIYLLVQKNSSKLENLLLIGYSPGHVARPYQLLTISLNIAVLIMAWGILFFVRNYYMGIIETLFPDMEDGSMLSTFIVGISLLVLVSICNLIAIRNKIARIWKRKE